MVVLESDHKYILQAHETLCPFSSVILQISDIVGTMYYRLKHACVQIQTLFFTQESLSKSFKQLVSSCLRLESPTVPSMQDYGDDLRQCVWNAYRAQFLVHSRFSRKPKSTLSLSSSLLSFTITNSNVISLSHYKFIFLGHWPPGWES